jgi:hypothetical protein
MSLGNRAGRLRLVRPNDRVTFIGHRAVNAVA